GTWLDPTVSAFRFFDPKYWPSTRSAYRDLAALIRSNGVKILAGTDQSSYLESKGSIPGQSLHEEMGLFVDAGFTPAAALWAATEGLAELLGLTESMGGIQAGKSADLVLLDADPLQEISNTRRIAAVIKQGHLYDSAALTRLRNLKPIDHHALDATNAILSSVRERSNDPACKLTATAKRRFRPDEGYAVTRPTALYGRSANSYATPY